MSNLSHFEPVVRQAKASLKRGWRIIPLRPKTKLPCERNWPNQRLTETELEEAFANAANIGVVLGKASGGLVDVDLDSSEAIALASKFLPATKRKHGRTSKPISHFFYNTSDPVQPEKFTDVDGSVLLELRSDRQQTVIPPSVHPSGERFRWRETGDPSKVTASELRSAAHRFAACALTARHWPNRGHRHDAAGALAGALLRHGLKPDFVTKFITSAARISGHDDEADNRAADVATTVRRLAAEQPAT